LCANRWANKRAPKPQTLQTPPSLTETIIAFPAKSESDIITHPYTHTHTRAHTHTHRPLGPDTAFYSLWFLCTICTFKSHQTTASQLRNHRNHFTLKTVEKLRNINDANLMRIQTKLTPASTSAREPCFGVPERCQPLRGGPPG